MVDHSSCCIGPPRLVFRRAEEKLRRRRAQPPDMAGAVAAALAAALAGVAPPSGAVATGLAIARAVAAHAASFTAGEPAYHDQYHQAEATIAMGWLCAAACRLNLLAADIAATGVLAMAGHDLLHDGSWPGAGVLEARSAAISAALAEQVGLDASAIAVIRRVILATNPLRPQAARDADDLICRLAQEADIFASLTPKLGWELSQALAREADAAGHRFDPPVASFAGRLVLLRWQQPATPAAEAFGLRDAVVDQIAAMAAFGDGDADRGAARLDSLPQAQARADYVVALAAVVRE
jgi:hypothetical protein